MSAPPGTARTAGPDGATSSDVEALKATARTTGETAANNVIRERGR